MKLNAIDSTRDKLWSKLQFQCTLNGRIIAMFEILCQGMNDEKKMVSDGSAYHALFVKNMHEK